jgi:hypothetical protein
MSESIPDPATCEDIAEWLGIPIDTVRQWARQRLFGLPVGKRGRAYEYERALIFDYGKRTGLFGEQGPDVTASYGRGRHMPEAPMLDERGKPMLGIPEAAALFGVKETTIEQWRWRSKAGGPPYLPDADAMRDRWPFWHESTLRRWGTQTNRLS